MSIPSGSPVRPQSGRAILILVVLLALAGVAVLFFGEQLGITGGSDGTGGTSIVDEGDALDGTEGNTVEEGESLDATTLAGLYGEGDRGAILLRVLRTGTKAPVTDQVLELVNRRGMDMGKVPTDASGQAVFKAIAPDRGYGILIRIEGLKPIHLRGIGVRKGETNNLGDIYVGENIVLRGRVVDAKGKALPAASVSVFQGTPELRTDGVMFAMIESALAVPSPLDGDQTDDGGYFTLSNLQDGVYRIEARRSGYGTGVRRDVVVQTEQQADTLTLTMTEGASLRGTVRSDSGEPIAGARVIAILDDGMRGFRSMATPQREYTTTDEKGVYVLDTLGRGLSYRFGVSAEGFPSEFATRAVEMEGDRERNFVLPEGGTLRGVVTDKADGRPIGGAVVSVSVGNWMSRDEKNTVASAIVRTAEDGTFELKGVKPGNVGAAQIKAPGYVTANYSQWTGNSWPEVKPGEVTDVRGEMEQGGIVRGLVTDAETSKPVAGAMVILENRASFWAGAPNAITDENGQYELVGVRQGEYGVVATADGYAPSDPQVQRVTMDEAGTDQTVDVSISAAGVVKGKVVDLDGEPVAGVKVRVAERREPQENAGGRQGRGRRGRGGSMTMRMLQASRGVIGVSDAQGRFVLKGVGVGRWVLRGETEESTFVNSESQPFRIGAGETETIELTMQPGAVLEGRVLDGDGRALPGATIQWGHLTDEQARDRNLSEWGARRILNSEVTTSGEDGTFRIEGIEPGKTLVRVRADGHVTWLKRNLVLQAGQVRDGYTVALGRGQVIEGVVRGTDGKPVRGAYVGATIRENPTRMGPEPVAEGEEAPPMEPQLGGRTDENGRFRIENVPEGRTYSVIVWFANGYQGFRMGGGQGNNAGNENAIKRGVNAQATGVEFRLEPVVTQQPGR